MSKPSISPRKSLSSFKMYTGSQGQIEPGTDKNGQVRNFQNFMISDQRGRGKGGNAPKKNVLSNPNNLSHTIMSYFYDCRDDVGRVGALRFIDADEKFTDADEKFDHNLTQSISPRSSTPSIDNVCSQTYLFTK